MMFSFIKQPHLKSAQTTEDILEKRFLPDRVGRCGRAGAFSGFGPHDTVYVSWPRPVGSCPRF